MVAIQMVYMDMLSTSFKEVPRKLTCTIQAEVLFLPIDLGWSCGHGT